MSNQELWSIFVEKYEPDFRSYMNYGKEEIDNMIEIVEKNTSCPDLIDLVYWNNHNLTSEHLENLISGTWNKSRNKLV